MTERKKIFNIIAPIYGLFYGYQRRKFARAIEKYKTNFDFTAFRSVLDVGCGTGALCAVLSELGLAVTGVEPAEKMLEIAEKKTANKNIKLLQADALQGLPFADDSFELVIASYVAHGLQKNERIKLYAEMSRVAQKRVIIYDYNQNRSLLTTVVEWLEGGDYFRFIREAEEEMLEIFSEVRVIDVDTRAAWYICTPDKI